MSVVGAEMIINIGYRERDNICFPKSQQHSTQHQYLSMNASPVVTLREKKYCRVRAPRNQLGTHAKAWILLRARGERLFQHRSASQDEEVEEEEAGGNSALLMAASEKT